MTACASLQSLWAPSPPPQVQIIRVTGYAALLNDPSLSPAQLTVMAQRASRMDAYRRLAEIIKGIQLSSQGKVGNLATPQEHLQSFVSGTIRGARQVRSRPVRNGSMWETVLEYKYNPAIALPLPDTHDQSVSDEDAEDAIDPYFYISH